MKTIYASMFVALFAVSSSATEAPIGMPETQSVFYMPLISWAYHTALKSSESDAFTQANLQALREPLAMVRTLIASEHSQQILDGMLQAILRHLSKPETLHDLGQAYLLDESPILRPGHIPGELQVQILSNAVLDQGTIDLINNTSAAGKEIDDEVKPFINNVETYMSLFIQTYYHFDLLPVSVYFGSVSAGFESTQLANQPVRCEGLNVLNQFKLSTADGRFHFAYTCTQGLKGGSVHQRHTEWNDEGNGNVIYFDRHDISCGEHEAIAGFELVRQMQGSTPTGRFRFEYGCKDASLRNLTTYYTGFNDDGAGKNIYLERHNIRCPGKSLLNAFRLVRSADQKQYQFEYKCGTNQ